MTDQAQSYKRTSRICYSVLALLVAVQWFFWQGIILHKGTEDEWVLWEGTRSNKPDLHIVPPVPTQRAVQALSLGDEQFYFRLKAFDIQNAGDTFGRTTPLKDYNYADLYKWWTILDSLDSRSNFVPPLVSYYYGSSQLPKRDLPYVIKYLEEHADTDPATKWWWYSQAVYHAKHRLEDLDLALRIAHKLAAIPEDVDAPLWVRQMPAFIEEAKGEYNTACKIILNIIRDQEGLKEGEINFMNYFIRERITAMVEAQKAPNAPKLDPECKRFIDAVIEQQEHDSEHGS